MWDPSFSSLSLSVTALKGREHTHSVNNWLIHFRECVKEVICAYWRRKSCMLCPVKWNSRHWWCHKTGLLCCIFHVQHIGYTYSTFQSVWLYHPLIAMSYTIPPFCVFWEVLKMWCSPDGPVMNQARDLSLAQANLSHSGRAGVFSPCHTLFRLAYLVPPEAGLGTYCSCSYLSAWLSRPVWLCTRHFIIKPLMPVCRSCLLSIATHWLTEHHRNVNGWTGERFHPFGGTRLMISAIVAQYVLSKLSARSWWATITGGRYGGARRTRKGESKGTHNDNSQGLHSEHNKHDCLLWILVTVK